MSVCPVCTSAHGHTAHVCVWRANGSVTTQQARDAEWQFVVTLQQARAERAEAECARLRAALEVASAEVEDLRALLARAVELFGGEGAALAAKGEE